MMRCTFALAVVVMTAAVGLPFNSEAISLNANGYYTWGIDPNEISIPDGYIITDAVVALYGLTSVSENPTDTLVVYLLDNPPTGFHENTDIPSVDHFASHGCRLTPDYIDRVKGHETVILRLPAIEDPSSWVWRIYERPFSLRFQDSESVAFSSSLLELVDYVGNGTPFGIGLDPAGGGDFTLAGLSLTLTIRSIQGSSNKMYLQLEYGETNSPPTVYAPPLRVVAEGSLLQVAFTATDPDNDPVQISCANLPPGAILKDNTFSWIPPYETAARGSAAPFAVTLTANDGVLSASRTFVIWVFNTNRPPLFAELTLLAVEEKTRLLYQVNVIDPDGDPLTCRAVQLPPGALFDPTTRAIRWDTIDVAPGAYDVTLATSDGLLEHTQTFSLDVSGIDRTVLTDRQTGLRLR